MISEMILFFGFYLGGVGFLTMITSLFTLLDYPHPDWKQYRWRMGFGIQIISIPFIIGEIAMAAITLFHV